MGRVSHAKATNALNLTPPTDTEKNIYTDIYIYKSMLLKCFPLMSELREGHSFESNYVVSISYKGPFEAGNDQKKEVVIMSQGSTSTCSHYREVYQDCNTVIINFC